MELQDLIKTKKIIKIAPEATLSHALSKLQSSHDAAFVFTKDDKLLGVINPYYSIIKSSLPGNAKVEHCLFHAPRLKNSDPISKVAKLMIESKIHYLPIFDDQDRFMGIASARHLLFMHRGSQLFDLNVGEFLKRKNQPLLTVYDTDYVSFAVNVFKTRKVSKLVVVNKAMKLYGVMAYYDLINFLILPRKKAHRGAREGDRENFQHQLVKNLAKTYVLTLHPSDNLKSALDLILDKGIGSVVVVDERRNPVGIITTRDFLRLLIEAGAKKAIEVTVKNLSDTSRRILDGFLSQMGQAMGKIPDVEKVKLFVKEEKRGGVFQTVVSFIPQKGHLKIIKRAGKNLASLLKDILSNIRSKVIHHLF